MIYFTADTHFNHRNIINFCQQPFSQDACKQRYGDRLIVRGYRPTLEEGGDDTKRLILTIDAVRAARQELAEVRDAYDTLKTHIGIAELEQQAQTDQHWIKCAQQTLAELEQQSQRDRERIEELEKLLRDGLDITEDDVWIDSVRAALAKEGSTNV